MTQRTSRFDDYIMATGNPFTGPEKGSMQNASGIVSQTIQCDPFVSIRSCI